MKCPFKYFAPPLFFFFYSIDLKSCLHILDKGTLFNICKYLLLYIELPFHSHNDLFKWTESLCFNEARLMFFVPCLMPSHPSWRYSSMLRAKIFILLFTFKFTILEIILCLSRVISPSFHPLFFLRHTLLGLFTLRFLPVVYSSF